MGASELSVALSFAPIAFLGFASIQVLTSRGLIQAPIRLRSDKEVVRLARSYSHSPSKLRHPSRGCVRLLAALCFRHLPSLEGKVRASRIAQLHPRSME